MSITDNRSICPDIYHPAVARDGLLTRLRLPGGVLSAVQCQTIVDLLATTGLESIHVTNRANLQLRGLDRDLAPELLTRLIACGLAAANPAVDGIRNIMTSPIAGIDPTELIDVRPLAGAWDEYLSGHPELGLLSNKFSVGFDGSGRVSILDRPNDITVLAVTDREFLLHLGLGARGDAPVNVGVRLTVAECIPMLAAIAQTYRCGVEALGGDTRRKPRLRDVIETWGLGKFERSVAAIWTGTSWMEWSLGETAQYAQTSTSADVCAHLGWWQQRQVGLSYVGVALPLGRMTGLQLIGLQHIASHYGSGMLRLTPWQNVIVPDLPNADLATVRRSIAELGLEVGVNSLTGLLTACTGASGCQFGATDTQADALMIAADVDSRLQLDRSLNIHVSGCDKSCAQHYQADIALWGCPQTAQRSSGYRFCIGGGKDKFGRELRDYLTPEDVRLGIDRLIRAYQERRTSPQESFRAFTDRQSLVQLQQILNVI